MTPYQKYKKAADARRERVMALHGAGYTQEFIAGKVKITRQRVGQIIAEQAKRVAK